MNVRGVREVSPSVMRSNLLQTSTGSEITTLCLTCHVDLISLRCRKCLTRISASDDGLEENVYRTFQLFDGVPDIESQLPIGHFLLLGVDLMLRNLQERDCASRRLTLRPFNRGTLHRDRIG